MNTVKIIKWGSLILTLVSAHAFAGTIMIHKVLETGDPSTEFSFSVTASGYDASFTLTGEGGPSGTKVLSGLANGSYTVTEEALAGFHVKEVICTLDDQPASSWAATGRELRILLKDDETVQCTFTNAAVGGFKIIKTAKWNKLERLPESFDFLKSDVAYDGEGNPQIDWEASESFKFHFRSSDFPSNGGESTRQIHKFYDNLPAGVYLFDELKPLIPHEVTGILEENGQWQVTDISCTCDGEECDPGFVQHVLSPEGYVIPYDRDGASGPLPEDSSVIARISVMITGGELIICTVHNEDVVCPAPLEPDNGGSTGSNNNGGSAGSNNNNNGASSQGTNGGLATTDVGASAGGCSSTGAGVAGLGTILMLLSSLVGVRAMRRVRVRN